MAKLTMIVFAVLLCLAAVVPLAHGDMTCQTVVDNLLPCKNYLSNGGAVPPSCCEGARALNSAANTPADRRAACQCMKAAANAYKVNPQYAAAVPSKCNVNVGYAVSYQTNCNNVS